MNENSGTYLRIFEDDGSWIARLDYHHIFSTVYGRWATDG
jgi:hypothetical protein